MSKPPKRITDPTFRYAPSFETNVRKTFDRIRKRLEKQRVANELERVEKVTPLAPRQKR